MIRSQRYISPGTLEYMIKFIHQCVDGKKGWKHTLIRPIRCDNIVYRCPDCQTIVENLKFCPQCRASMCSAFIIKHIKQRRGDMFFNIALSHNRSNYSKLRKYLLTLHNRGWIKSYTLRPERLKVTWFERYVPRVIKYFDTYKFKYCPPNNSEPDTKNRGFPNAIKGDNGKITIENNEPFHWHPTWKDEAKEKQKTYSVRQERTGADIREYNREATKVDTPRPKRRTKIIL